MRRRYDAARSADPGGHPVVGDRTYGGVRHHMASALRPVERLERPFLHAGRLAFAHPRDGRRLEFEAPLPDDLQSVLNAILEKLVQQP